MICYLQILMLNELRSKNQSLTIDLTNLPDAQLMLECRFYKADTKLYIDIATNFHAMHSYQFPFHWAYLTGHNKIDEKIAK